MSEIKYINSAVDVVVSNADFDRNDPPYICYDENWVDIGRCHNFAGIDCEILYKEPRLATYAKAGLPKRVYIQVNGSVQLDPDFPDGRKNPSYILVPSRRGMESDPVQPIWCNGLCAYSRVTITGFYYGRYDLTKPNPLWIECDKCVGSI